MPSTPHDVQQMVIEFKKLIVQDPERIWIMKALVNYLGPYGTSLDPEAVRSLCTYIETFFDEPQGFGRKLPLRGPRF